MSRDSHGKAMRKSQKTKSPINFPVGLLWPFYNFGMLLVVSKLMSVFSAHRSMVGALLRAE